jgi:dTDP-4-dehydrorhamnose 3,5-epimerase-like enzyme
MSAQRISQLSQSSPDAALGNYRVLPFAPRKDNRGVLSVIEFDSDFPFIPNRLFWISEVPLNTIRGNHAHKDCTQILIATQGEIVVSLEDGKSRIDLLLDSPDFGLLIPKMTWSSQKFLSQNSQLLVLASDRYDERDYIRKYETFLKMCES